MIIHFFFFFFNPVVFFFFPLYSFFPSLFSLELFSVFFSGVKLLLFPYIIKFFLISTHIVTFHPDTLIFPCYFFAYPKPQTYKGGWRYAPKLLLFSCYPFPVTGTFFPNTHESSTLSRKNTRKNTK